jgi:hypothetical protein
MTTSPKQLQSHRHFSEDEKLDILSQVLQKHGQDIFAPPEYISDQDAKVQMLLNQTLFVRKARRPYSKWLPMAALLLVGINAMLFYDHSNTHDTAQNFSPREEVVYSTAPILTRPTSPVYSVTYLEHLIANTHGDLEKAKILFDHHYYSEALHYASLAQKKNPKNLDALTLIHNCLQKLGDKKN